MLRRTLYITLSIAALVAAMSFIAPSQAKLVITFNSYVGNQLLKLDSATYKNELGQPYTVSKLRYYVGNLSLITNEGTSFHSDEYFLVDETNDSSKQVTLRNVPPGNYTTISFIIGVDSLQNCSGAQSGALDPANAMFWTWNSGYIFIKMEGASPLSKSPGHLLEFHVGGYKAPYNCIRTVKLSLKNSLQIANGNAALNIKTDLSQLFKAQHVIDFSKISSVTDFHNSTTIADNYAQMFSILQ